MTQNAALPLSEALKDLDLIEAICKRAVVMAARANVCCDMDRWVHLIASAHATTPLELEELATSEDRVFAADVFGLNSMFCPRALMYYAPWRPSCLRVH